MIRWIADKIHRWIEVNRTRKVIEKIKEVHGEKAAAMASAIANPKGAVEDYVATFKNFIDECLKEKPVTFFKPEMMTEAGAKEFNDPKLGKVRNARIEAGSWLRKGPDGKWESFSLGRGPACHANFQREVIRPLTTASKHLQMESNRNTAMQKENDWWGTAPDAANMDFATFNSSTTLQKNLPYPPGPFTKQLYLQDMWKLDALIFQFCNYSGLAKRALAIKAAYILGNGIKIDFENDDTQTDWDATEDEIGIYDVWLRWIIYWLKYGELNVNPWIGVDKKLKVRAIDRSTIWDIVTNPEDVFDIHGYWVQFTTQYQLFTKGTDNVEQPYTKYVMRMMPPDSIIQIKRNVEENEKRGRSDLIAGLAYISYYDDYLRAVVLRTIMEASYVWDIELQFGDQTDVDREALKEANFPNPGQSFFHTSSLKRTLSGFTGAIGRGQGGKAEEIIGGFAIAVGVPEEFLGQASQANKAAALTGTAPFVKETQVNQKQFEVMIRKVINFWLEGTGRKGQKFEVIFPEISPADMFTKIQAIVLSQTSGYYSIERAATMTAKELNDTTYAYEAEKAKIDKEKAALLTDAPTEQGLYPPQPGQPMKPTQPKKVPIPGAGLPKLTNKVTGPPGADDKLDGSGIGA